MYNYLNKNTKYLLSLSLKQTNKTHKTKKKTNKTMKMKSICLSLRYYSGTIFQEHLFFFCVTGVCERRL